MSKWASAAITASAVGILLIAGCGGGKSGGGEETTVSDGKSRTQEKPVSSGRSERGSEEKAASGGRRSKKMTAYVRRLNRICVALNRKAASKILKAYDNPRVKRAISESEAIALEVELFAPIVQADAEAQASAIHLAHFPVGADTGPVNEILESYRVWIDVMRLTPRKAIVANDVFNEARMLDRRYGLVDCARNPYGISAPAAHGGR